MAVVLDGKQLAKLSEQQLKAQVAALPSPVPALATVQVGVDPASTTYVNMKHKACARVGLDSQRYNLPADASEQELLDILHKLNDDPQVAGILLQHPIADHMNTRTAFDSIDVDKDVDGLTTSGFGIMAMNGQAWSSSTPLGIMRLLEHYDIGLSGQHAVVIGRSPILGKPMAAMMTNADATVTLCHSRTKNLPELVGSADIIVAALGQPEYVKADWIRDQAVVVDAGFHPGPVGDVELTPELCERVAAYTPVPGGVGPMTINTLITQTVAAAEHKAANV